MPNIITLLRTKPDKSLVDELELLIRDVVGRLDERQECDALIARINELCGGANYDETTFFELYGWTDERDFAETAARGIPPILDVSKTQLVEIVRMISEDPGSESEYLLKFLETNFPESSVSDIIYWPHKELSYEEVVEEILVRNGIFLKQGVGAVHEHKLRLAQDVVRNPDSPLWAQTWAEGFLNS